MPAAEPGVSRKKGLGVLSSATLQTLLTIAWVGCAEPPADTSSTHAACECGTRKLVSARMEKLIELLGAEDPEIRLGASNELLAGGSSWSEADLDALELAGQSEDAEVSSRAQSSALAIRRRRRVAELLGALKTEADSVLHDEQRSRLDFLISTCSAWSAGEVTDEAILALTSLAVEEHWGDEVTLGCISHWGATRACRQVVVRMVGHEDSRRAGAAATMCAEEGFTEAAPHVCRALQRLDGVDTFDADRLLDAAASLGVAEDRALVNDLANSGSARARAACCRLLKLRFRHEFADVAIRLSSDQDEEVRSSAIAALAVLARPEGIGPVLRAVLRGKSPRELDLDTLRGQFDARMLDTELDSEDPEVRARAVWLLQWATGALPQLEHALTDKSADVRRNAAYAAGRSALGELGPALAERLHDEAPQVRRDAAIALGLLGTPEEVDALRAVASTGGREDKSHALAGLSLLGDAASLPTLLEAYPPESMGQLPLQDVGDAYWLLGMMGGSTSLARLRDAAASGPHSEIALYVLSAFGEPSDLPQLDRLLRDQTPCEDLSDVLSRTETMGGISGHTVDALMSTDLNTRVLAALGLRHASGADLPDGVTAALGRMSPPSSRDVLVLGCAQVALGTATPVVQRSVVNRLRGMDSEEIAIALGEALLKKGAPEVWLRWTREEKAPADVRTADDVRELLESRGFAIQEEVGRGFHGRIAAGTTISARRLILRCREHRVPVVEERAIRLVTHQEALRIWADRLER